MNRGSYVGKDRRSVTRRGALALIGSGICLSVVGSDAVTTIEGERQAATAVTDDSDAYLGIVDQSSTATIENSSDEATVYELTDNSGVFSTIEATVVSATDSNNNQYSDPPVEAEVVDQSTTNPSVRLRCTAADDSIDDSYDVVVDIAASGGGLSTRATRATADRIPISCTIDYGDSGNYRDDDGGGAVQPTDPSGNIENPSAVNDDDDNTATAISTGGQADLKIGYALPRVDQTADTYEMIFDIERLQIGQGSFGFYLVNGAGQQLTDRQALGIGTNTYSFPESEEQQIAANHDDLYLIIDSNTNGNGNREMDLDYFRLVAR